MPLTHAPEHRTAGIPGRSLSAPLARRRVPSRIRSTGRDRR